MRCASCDVVLTDYESKRKHKVTGEYLDLCSSCLGAVQEVVHFEYVGKSTNEGMDYEENNEA